jgi:hypothetical protein
MGTNTLPFLLSDLQYEESPLVESVKRLGRKIPFLHIPSPRQIPDERNYAAAFAFMWLGSNAAPAVPQLIKMYNSHPNASWSSYVPLAVGFVGPPAKQAVPMLLCAITNTNSTRARVVVGAPAVHIFASSSLLIEGGEAVGEGADSDTRGRACSQDPRICAFGEEWGARPASLCRARNQFDWI